MMAEPSRYLDVYQRRMTSLPSMTVVVRTVFVSFAYWRKMTMKRELMVLWSLLFASCFLGCSNQVKVSGRVTFAEDGSPLTVGAVCFEANGQVARGYLDHDGNYRLTSIKENDGVLPGSYRVFIDGALVPVGTDSVGAAAKVGILDHKYTSPYDPAYTFEVSRSNKVFDFTVERVKR